MSGIPTHDADHESQDKIAFSKVILVGVVSLVVFALGILWALALLRHETARVERLTGKYHEPLLGSQEIGIVDQVPFTSDHRLEIWRRERAARLGNYGWVDRGKGLVHIPIERAMDAVAAGALPEGAPK